MRLAAVNFTVTSPRWLRRVWPPAGLGNPAGAAADRLLRRSGMTRSTARAGLWVARVEWRTSTVTVHADRDALRCREFRWSVHGDDGRSH